jgi:hypothetical protein
MAHDLATRAPARPVCSFDRIAGAIGLIRAAEQNSSSTKFCVLLFTPRGLILKVRGIADPVVRLG